MCIEIIFGILMIILTLAGLWVSPYFLGAGYMIHGFWDIVHRPELVRTTIPRWYIPFCSLFDWILCVFILVWLV